MFNGCVNPLLIDMLQLTQTVVIVGVVINVSDKSSLYNQPTGTVITKWRNVVGGVVCSIMFVMCRACELRRRVCMLRAGCGGGGGGRLCHAISPAAAVSFRCFHSLKAWLLH